MSNEIEKSIIGDRNISRGEDTMIPSAEALDDLVDKLAARMMGDFNNVAPERHWLVWNIIDGPVKENYRNDARSALAFMRETIQTELARTNSSLDISSKQEIPHRKIDILGRTLRDELRRSIMILFDQYTRSKSYPEADHFVLRIDVDFEKVIVEGICGGVDIAHVSIGEVKR